VALVRLWCGAAALAFRVRRFRVFCHCFLTANRQHTRDTHPVFTYTIYHTKHTPAKPQPPPPRLAKVGGGGPLALGRRGAAALGGRPAAAAGGAAGGAAALRRAAGAGAVGFGRAGHSVWGCWALRVWLGWSLCGPPRLECTTSVNQSCHQPKPTRQRATRGGGGARGQAPRALRRRRAQPLGVGGRRRLWLQRQ
jgi:hypothetical protein